MKTDFEIMKKNIEANMLRIQQLLEQEGIENKFNEGFYYSVNRNNTELRNRLKMLRKDSLTLEKLFK